WEEEILLLPGVRFRIPFWDRVYVLSVRQRVVADTNKLAMSRDQKTFCVSTAIEFAIHNIEQLYHSVSNPETMMGERAGAAIVQYMTTHDSCDITPQFLEDAATAALADSTDWGLTAPRVRVSGFAQLRTYRLIMNDYRHGAGLYDIEEKASR
ncbi:hypothetical protein LCGC14_3150080, partial [marine sediment metagenome]